MPSTTSLGRQAEEAAANHLLRQGFTIIERNWRTRWCEIDIVGQKDDALYFVEVKYRQSAIWGGGLEYITSQKMKQMQFAADMWVSTHGWDGDYHLSGIEVSGANFTVTECLLSLS